MTQEALNFGPNQESGLDELGGSSPYAINVIIDKNGTVYKRPGIVRYAPAPSDSIDANGISGLYASNDGQLFAVGADGFSNSIYKISGGSALNLSGVPGSVLTGTLRPTFTETELFLIIAAGGSIQKVNLQTLISQPLGGSPPTASHVAANSSRLLANDLVVDKTKVRFSGIFQGTTSVGEMEDWTFDGNIAHGGFFTAEARPDNVVALHENTNEVFVWGVDNVQVFAPDAASVFLPGATREYGCLAPYSIIKSDQHFFWLDQHRRFVYSDGREFQNVEQPIKRQLEALTAPTDCFGFRVLLGHIECFVWSFPTDGIAFCYQKDGGWSEWLGWDSSQSNFKRFIVNAHYLRRDGGVNVVGTTDGRIGQLSLSTYDDLGELVVASTATGFIDHGTDNRKLCKSIKISARRWSNSTASLGRLEWRDDTGNWNGPLFVDFGSTGDNYVVKEFRSLGIYNRRQWRFIFSDSANLALVRVLEDFDTLSI